MTTTWSPADASAGGYTLANGNMSITATVANWNTVRSSSSCGPGQKLYIEINCVAVGAGGNGQIFIGFANAAFSNAQGNYLGAVNYSAGMYMNSNYLAPSAGTWTQNYQNSAPYGGYAGDILMLAIDYNAQKIFYGVNGVWVNNSNPATGTAPIFNFNSALTGPLFMGLTAATVASQFTLQPNKATQMFLPPAGFTTWDGETVSTTPGFWRSQDANAIGATLSNGGQTVALPSPGGTDVSVRTSTGQSSGKLYVEFKYNTIVSTTESGRGVANLAFNPSYYLGSVAAAGVSAGFFGGGNSMNPAASFTSNATAPAYPANGDVWALAIDFTNRRIWLAINGAWVSGNPGTGASPMMTFIAGLTPLYAGITGNQADVVTLQSTRASQKYAPPTGFSAWDGPGVAKAGSAALMIGV